MTVAGGLALELDRPVKPGLRVEVAAGRRLVLWQADRIVLLARQRQRWLGVHYARTDAYRSPLPHLTAAQARQVPGGAWAHRFVNWLVAAADGPLHAGRWMVHVGMPKWTVAAHWPNMLTFDPDRGHITWFGYGDPDEDARDVLPLRRLSPPDAPRVKSYRRQYREGVLPPVLLWWFSGMDSLLVLDGHDRIVAALAEGAVPDVLVLAPPMHDRWVAAVQAHSIRAYEGRMAHFAPQGATMWIERLGRDFAADLRNAERAEGRARAWPLPGGASAWQAHAAALAPDWAPE
ncbi:MAG TPA: hypothetical protein VGG05_24565 [Pseudonocardiaceae bacterium]